MRAAAAAGIVVSVLGAALVWTGGLIGAFTLPKLLLLSAGVALAGAALAADRAASRPDCLDGPLVAALAALTVTTAFSIDPALSFVGRYNAWSHGVWTLGLYAAVLLGAGAAFRQRETAALRGLALLGCALGADALLQRLDLDPVIRRQILPLGRAIGTLGSPVDLGALLTLLFPLTLAAALEGGARWGAAPLVVAAGLWATGSRGAWLGGACGFFALLALGGAPSLEKRLPPKARAAAGALALAVVVAGPLALAARAKADAARVEVWKTAWAVFRQSPTIGMGPDTFEATFRRYRTPAFIHAMGRSISQQAYAHDDILQALATTGLLGLAVYLWLLGALAAAARRALAGPGKVWAAAAASALIALFANLKFNPVSLEVFTAAAATAGLLVSLGERESKPRGRAVFAVFALVGAVSTLGAARLWRADAREFLALQLESAGRLDQAAAAHRAALALAPCELSYQRGLVNTLISEVNAVHDASARRRLLDEASATGQLAVRCSGESVDAHYISGFAEAFAAQLGLTDRLALADRELDAALQLDPMFEPLLRARLGTAMLRKDQAKIAELQERLQRLQNLIASGAGG